MLYHYTENITRAYAFFIIYFVMAINVLIIIGALGQSYVAPLFNTGRIYV